MALSYGWIVVLALVVLAGLGTIVQRMQDPHLRRGMSLVWRLKLRMHPGPGFAHRFHLWRKYGGPPARKVARQARPRLGGWWRRLLTDPRAYTTFLGWAQGWVFPVRVFATLEDIVLVLAPPKEGKSAWACGRIVDAPGAVVATSIRGDLVDETAGLRAQRGSRVTVFNPERVGHWESTIRWSPVPGSEDPFTAIRRAAYMVRAVETSNVSDKDFWKNQAQQVLAAMLHAAALGQYSVVDIYRWVTTFDTTPVKILSMRWPGLDTEIAASIVQGFLTNYDNARKSIALTLTNCLRVVESPATRWAVTPEPSESFDIVRFIKRRGTLYMVASDNPDTPTPPLFSALLGEIHETACRLAARRKGGRLDPPLTMVLDEIANICPVPVDSWSTTASGFGISMVLIGQSWSQFIERWGPNGAKTIRNAAKAKMFYPSISDPEDLQQISDLCGKVNVYNWEESVDQDGKRRRHRRPELVPVLPPEHIRMLPDWHAVVVRSNAKPTIVRIERVWKRRDHKQWAKAGRPVPLPLLDHTAPFQLDRGDEITRRRVARALEEPVPVLASPPAPEEEGAPTQPNLPRAVSESEVEPPFPEDELRRRRPPYQRRPWDRQADDNGEDA